MTKLEELAVRVEALGGPSMEVDAEIAQAYGHTETIFSRKFGGEPNG